jgi:hypothetical protein
MDEYEGGAPPMMKAGEQAEALEYCPPGQEEIKAFHKRLAEQGASAMQPKGSQSFGSQLDAGGEDYSSVEPEDPREF